MQHFFLLLAQPPIPSTNLVQIPTAPGARPHALPRDPKRGDCAAVPALQGDKTRQHPRRGHRRRKPQTYTRAHLDHHPPLSGRSHRAPTRRSTVPGDGIKRDPEMN